MTIPPRLAAFASRISLTGLAIAILVALLAVQTVRLEGFKLWPLSIEGWKPKAERYERTINELDEKMKAARDDWEAAILKREQAYRDLAQRTDDNAEQALSDAMDAAERHIAANRVRCEGNRGGVSGPTANPEGGSAGGSNRPGGASELVAVTENDVRVCTANTIRLEAAREWGLSLAE